MSDRFERVARAAYADWIASKWDWGSDELRAALHDCVGANDFDSCTAPRIAPVPDAALRERIAKSAFSVLHPNATDPFEFGFRLIEWEIADAVLAAMPPVDGVTVPRDLAERLQDASEIVAFIALGSDDQATNDSRMADAASIRALLGGDG